jgi:hypothetical protein
LSCGDAPNTVGDLLIKPRVKTGSNAEKEQS